ncbi:Metallo-dependent phosphatase-like protein [Aspergillus unguis]
MRSPRFFSVLYTLSVAACASAVPIQEQQVLGFDNHEDTIDSKQLSGRFLHITDFHLDTHYKPGSSVERVCHRDNGSAGPLGSEGSDCDSPNALVDQTFRWIEKNLKGKIDFVLWTGDSARHDNDEKIPRTADEIIDLNEIIAAKFVDLLEAKGSNRGLSIPVIPTIGNNDIMPHNIFKSGPNRWTKRFTEIWSSFIPESQRHSFEEGGWFAAELIPNRLAAISLNTMYFYESNSAVDGCAAKSEAGYEHMEWLRVQLELLRGRNMKAILIGHVPPARSGTKQSWDESCWQKYSLFVNRFRDVVVGSVYGHMNIDHFMLQDSHDVDIVAAMQDTNSSSDPSLSVQSSSTYLSSLRDDWADMPSPPGNKVSDIFADAWDIEDQQDDVTDALGKKQKRFLKKIGGPYAERYSLSLVSPSVVPNYFPTLRVVEYNTTGLEGVTLWADTPYSDDSFEGYDWNAAKRQSLDENGSDLDEQGKKHKKHKKKKDKKKKDKKKKKPKPNFKVPDHPSKTAPPGPAYSGQAFTWLSYSQYYANLTEIYGKTENRLAEVDSEAAENYDNLYQIEYDTKDDKVYKMTDLTVRSYFKLAKRIAKRDLRTRDAAEESAIDLSSETSTTDDESLNTDITTSKKNQTKKKHKNHIWRTFFTRAFVGLVPDDELDDLSA